MRDLVGVGVLEVAEELLVPLDVLAAVELDAGVHRAFGPLVRERAGEGGELVAFDELHGFVGEYGGRSLAMQG